EGMKISASCCTIGSSIPGNSPVSGGGPICLGRSKGVSEPYSSNGMFRVFLDSQLCSTFSPTPPTQFLLGDKRLWRDKDNPDAVLVMFDIPPEKILYGTHSEVLLKNPTSNRTREILRCIASFDKRLPSDHSRLGQLHAEAVKEGYIADDWHDD